MLNSSKHGKFTGQWSSVTRFSHVHRIETRTMKGMGKTARVIRGACLLRLPLGKSGNPSSRTHLVDTKPTYVHLVHCTSPILQRMPSLVPLICNKEGNCEDSRDASWASIRNITWQDRLWLTLSRPGDLHVRRNIVVLEVLSRSLFKSALPFPVSQA
jgi:hypothetical protein